MLFALLAIVSMLLGITSGVPLANYHPSVNGSTALTATFNSTNNFAAHYVPPTVPLVCTTTNIFCFTVQTANGALVDYEIFGKKPAFSKSHDFGAYRTFAWTYTVAGAANLHCNAQNPVDREVKVSFGFSVGGTSYVSLSTNGAIAKTLDGKKSLTSRGSIETDGGWPDFVAYCHDF